MAVKKKKQKKNFKNDLLKIAVKIKCCYCDNRRTCKYKSRKEKDESRGCMTYCTITPNITKKTQKTRKQVKK